MLIDWFTVIAQIINFLVLVWLLKRLLYGPIMKAISTREARIAADISSAREKEAEALRERTEFEARNATFDKERKARMAKAVEEVEAKRAELEEQVRAENEAMRKRALEALENERNALQKTFAGQVRNEVFAIARRTLTDLASSELDERIAETFIARLEAPAMQEKETLASALLAAKAASVRSSQAVPKHSRERLQKALEHIAGKKIDVDFRTDPEGINGIELVAGDHKVSWTIAAYMDELEAHVNASAEMQQPSGAGTHGHTH